MNGWDQFKVKYAAFDISGKLITVLFLTTIIGWFLYYTYLPAYLQFVLPSGFSAALLQPWSWITYGLIHDGLWHFIGNALGIYIAGRYILNIFKARQFLTLFFLGVFAGALSFILASGLFPTFFRSPGLIGASAGVFALILFSCAYFPESEYRLIFLNIKLKYVAYFLLATNIVMVAFQINTGGSLGHLAGAAVGYFAAVRMKEGDDILESFARIGDFFINLFKPSVKKSKSEHKAKMKTVYKGKTASSKTASTVKSTDQKKVDAILDKISASGYESLSKAEKDYLFKAGKD
ncbi:rhomboid family intramembrane serine protease [uncultured Nonlabens sp.]|uniref:rhomboid family intramembrane serine protease n=1 Tax=uncultured Nonlabens sp. TaxID=859306 RepID=UPI00260265C1|nr:rhomboid family intramembrane serine protease [uncultured Nonlabens sp.]